MRLKKTSEAFEWVQNENEISAKKNTDFESKDLLPYLKVSQDIAFNFKGNLI